MTKYCGMFSNPIAPNDFLCKTWENRARRGRGAPGPAGGAVTVSEEADSVGRVRLIRRKISVTE